MDWKKVTDMQLYLLLGNFNSAWSMGVRPSGGKGRHSILILRYANIPKDKTPTVSMYTVIGSILDS